MRLSIAHWLIGFCPEDPRRSEIGSRSMAAQWSGTSCATRRGTAAANRGKFSTWRGGFGAKRGGFTLVELLVVIGIIAVLVGMLMPALSRVRKQAGMVACSSNLHQIGMAWTMYLGDSHGRFPQLTANLQWFYGGRQPCGFDFEAANQLNGVSIGKKDRPLNPYLGLRLSGETKAAVFRCPKDGLMYANVGNLPSPTHGEETFEYWGNSYYMNQSFLGFGYSVTMSTVKLPTSRVVLLGDWEWFQLMLNSSWNADFHQMALRRRISCSWMDMRRMC